MATKAKIESSEMEALTKYFCSGCGAHLGIIGARGIVKNPGHYELVQTQFTELMSRGWAFGELHELLKEAQKQERLVRKPTDLVEGRISNSKRKDPSRNLMLEGDTRDTRIFWHGLLKPRRMPVIELVRSPGTAPSAHHVASGFTGEYIASFTMTDLLAYWEEKIGTISYDTAGSMFWLLDQYGLSVVLHSIDRLSADMMMERDVLKRSRTVPFDLKPFAQMIENERSEAQKWL